MLPVLKKYWWLLLLTAALFAVIQSVGGQSDNMQKRFFAIGGVELMGFQKLALSFALFGLFAWFPAPPGRVVEIIADTSFAIFFLHPFVLNLFGRTTLFQLTHLPWINLAITTTAIVTLCTLFAMTVRALLKAESKYLTGY